MAFIHSVLYDDFLACSMGVSVVLGAGGLRGVGHVAFLRRLHDSDIVLMK